MDRIVKLVTNSLLLTLLLGILTLPAVSVGLLGYVTPLLKADGNNVLGTKDANDKFEEMVKQTSQTSQTSKTVRK